MNRDSRGVRRSTAVLPCLLIGLITVLATGCKSKSKPVTQCESSTPMTAGEVPKSSPEREFAGTERVNVDDNSDTPKPNENTNPGEAWKAALARTLANADRVVIYDSPLHEETDRKPLEIADKKVIDEFLQALEIDAEDIVAGIVTHCMCMGEVQIEFRRGEESLAWLSFHHGKSLRWCQGEWEGDADLTPESKTKMADWLAKHGKLAIAQFTTVKLP